MKSRDFPAGGVTAGGVARKPKRGVADVAACGKPTSPTAASPVGRLTGLLLCPVTPEVGAAIPFAGILRGADGIEAVEKPPGGRRSDPPEDRNPAPEGTASPVQVIPQPQDQGAGFQPGQEVIVDRFRCFSAAREEGYPERKRETYKATVVRVSGQGMVYLDRGHGAVGVVHREEVKPS